MARYQLRRPTPVVVVPGRFRRQQPGPTPAPAAEEEEKEEEEEGPESPDSLASSPSTVGAGSESEDSEEEDEEEEDEEEEEPPSPTVNEAVNPSQQAANGTLPSLSLLSSQGSSLAALPQVTGIASSTVTSQPTITATPAPSVSSPVKIQSTVAPTSSASAATPAQSDTERETSLPLQAKPQDERTLITKGAAAAAITLSVLGNASPLKSSILHANSRRCFCSRHCSSASHQAPQASSAIQPAPRRRCLQSRQHRLPSRPGNSSRSNKFCL